MKKITNIVIFTQIQKVLKELSTLIFVIFLILKATNVIDWNWWIICSPIIFATVTAIILIILVRKFKKSLT